MVCPICLAKAYVSEKRVAEGLYCVVHRKYYCTGCLTHFKTSEKVLLGSLPSYIRQNFLEDGKRGR